MATVKKPIEAKGDTSLTRNAAIKCPATLKASDMAIVGYRPLGNPGVGLDIHPRLDIAPPDVDLLDFEDFEVDFLGVKLLPREEDLLAGVRERERDAVGMDFVCSTNCKSFFTHN
jgi:hypothetical protein